ncbi:MAG TPA: phosphate ABC transporter permease subunit PstC [Thermoanaerobaculia bacterium]|nr:phosphate ABC transporter permease subunit PstC [Thermoanaerobaculia bacterium]
MIDILGTSAAPRRRWPRWEITRLVSLGFTLFGIAALAYMLALLIVQSLPVWRQSEGGYLTGTEWFFRDRRFGILSMVYGTAAVSLIALTIAGFLGVGTAIFTAEVLPRRWRLGLKLLIELLAGIPSVVYGILGMLLLRDWIYKIFERWDVWSGDTLLTGGILLAVMILPTVVTLADDALRGVPAAQRQAARALGLNRAEAIVSVSLPQALPGLLAAVLLGLGRALGETIAVFMVVGRQDNQWPEKLLSLRPLVEPGQMLTTKLGGAETFIAYAEPLHWGAIVGLALVLLALVLGVTLAGTLIGRLGDHHA